MYDKFYVLNPYNFDWKSNHIHRHLVKEILIPLHKNYVDEIDKFLLTKEIKHLEKADKVLDEFVVYFRRYKYD